MESSFHPLELFSSIEFGRFGFYIHPVPHAVSSPGAEMFLLVDFFVIIFCLLFLFPIYL
jgi:hypothetical protein